jgi:hypothetical protein
LPLRAGAPLLRRTAGFVNGGELDWPNIFEQNRVQDRADIVDKAVAQHLEAPLSSPISSSQMWQPFGTFCTIFSVAGGRAGSGSA